MGMDTPKVGDIVRVVLVGKVTDTDTFIQIGEDKMSANAIVPGAEHVKFIEILTPAKPSVADLPAWAVVKNKDTGAILQRMAATDRWEVIAGSAGHVNSRSLDNANWIQMVEKSDG